MSELVTIEPPEVVHLRQTRADQNPAMVYLASLAPGSRRTMGEALTTIARWLTRDESASGVDNIWWSLRYPHAVAVRSWLAERYSPATANKMLCALRRVCEEAWKLDQMSAEDYHRIAGVKAVKNETLPAGRQVTEGEVAAFLSACAGDDGPSGVRDAAMFAVMVAGGLRRAEVCSLDLADATVEDGLVSLLVRGKRNKDRIVPMNNGQADAVLDWLVLRGEDPGPLFIPIDKGGTMHLRRMTDQAVYHMLSARAASAGMSSFSPHDLRRTFFSNLLEAGVDLVIASQLGGHSNVQTTARYDRRPEEAKRKAAGMLFIPYRRRFEG